MYADGENMPRRSICSLRHIFASSIIFLSCDIFRAKGGTPLATFVPPVLVKIYHPKVRGWQKRGSLADPPDLVTRASRTNVEKESVPRTSKFHNFYYQRLLTYLV